MAFGGSDILRAALACFARDGIDATSLDDVAAEAGIGRSTVYRAFPGGKVALVDAATSQEVERFVHVFTARVSETTTLRETIVEAVVLGTEAIQTWPALRALLQFHASSEGHDQPYREHEIVFTQMRELFAPQLERFLDPATARRITDWGSRIVVSYAMVPDDDVDLTDPAQAAQLTDLLLMPAIRALRPQPAQTP